MGENSDMQTVHSHPAPRRATQAVCQRIDRGGERLWRMDDFRDLPFAAVARALSRLARAGKLERLSKGVYYRGRGTAFGPSRPNPAAIRRLATSKHSLFPSGIAAANLLGLSTQSASSGELATSASSVPRKLIGPDAVVHTRRPEAWSHLSEVEAALLDFLRRGGRTSELTPEDTIRRTLSLLAEGTRYQRLVDVAGTEPPRVRALLGALGEQLGGHPGAVQQLRDSLNPLSRFDFGLFADLPNAKAWQAKDRRP